MRTLGVRRGGSHLTFHHFHSKLKLMTDLFCVKNTQHCSAPDAEVKVTVGLSGVGGPDPPAEEPGPEHILQALLVAHSDATMPSTS